MGDTGSLIVGTIIAVLTLQFNIYQPAVTKEKTQKQFVNKMINSLFAGSSADLVMHALGGNNTSSDELEKIQILINELKAKK